MTASGWTLPPSERYERVGAVQGRSGRRWDALLVLLCLAIGAAALRLGEGPRAPGERLACPVPVAVDGRLSCLSESVARRRGLRSGDAQTRRGTGRMPPSWIEALGVPVDLNRASLAELQTLEGVGPALSRRIVRARPFASVPEIERVRGIGPATVRRIAPRAYVDR